MKIAVFGGSFDPPHLGHILIARQVLKYAKMDEVWLMPVASHAFDKKISSPTHRMKMTKFLEINKISASDFEVKLGGMSKTITTMRKLAKAHPKDKFAFIIGSDQLSDFKKWEEWENLIKEFGLIIFPREIVQDKLKELVLKSLGFKKLPSNVLLLDSQEIVLTDISSSKIRKRVKDKLSLDLLVPKKVEEYIKKNKLYV